MKLTYYGTAAAEGWPALWCNCPSCKTARERRGKNIRTRSQAMVNDDLLLDFPPDTNLHILDYGLDLDKIQNVLITHSHEDHLLATEFPYRMPGFCGVHEDFVLHVYGNDAVIKLIDDYLIETHQKETLLAHTQFHELVPYQEYQIGAYKVYPMLADHKIGEKCLIYAIIAPDGKQLLYAHDTGYFPRQTWDYMQEKGFVFDLASLDCTAGKLQCWTNHMAYDSSKAVAERLLKTGNATASTVFIWNHFSHNCKVLGYEEMVEDGKDYGFDVSYDGKVVEV
jgi:phosphoribosyl 1,2-cyclic phosphate phosphodiesterase